MAKKQDSKTLGLLDAHAILHRAFHALPDFSSPTGEPTGALYGVVAMLLKIIEDLKPDYIVACFDLPEPTYRHEAFDGYKAKREKTDDSLVAQINRSRDIFAAFHIPIYEHVGFEADDMLGTIVEMTKGERDLHVIIASGDMDTLQLVDKKKVTVYTLRKGIKDTILYDEKTVVERFGFPPKLVADYKGLRGDTSDNIPGIVGIGEKIATELITTFGSIEAIYKKLKKDEQAFVDAGFKPRVITLLKENEEEAQFSKMLATIRRDAPIDFQVPTQSWKEAADTEAILTLFSELGFRTLSARIKSIFALKDEASIDQITNQVSDEDVAKAAVLLWLLESDRTKPSFDDIVDYGRSYFGTTDFSEIVTKLEAAVREHDLLPIYESIEEPLLLVLRAVNQTGITLDVAYLKKLSKTFRRELSGLEKDIYSLAGSEFNINSPKQLGEVLYDTLGLKPKNQKKTATGQRTTREAELVKMQDEHPIIEKILRYRELQKLVSTYIDNLPDMVGDDGRLRTTFIQTGTTTGRIASKDPNLQNIPVRSEEGRAVRKAFVASKGYQLVSIDYSQIELRIAAMLSGDTKLIDIFKRGEDVHTGVAVRVFGVSAEEVTPEMRRRAKVINFGILYGMGVNALRQNLGGDTSREEAQQFLNAYFNTFTRLAEYLEETKAFAREHGYTTTMFGRHRHFAGITSSAPFIRAAAERMAINAPIQGTEGDILRIAMINIDTYIKEHKLEDTVRMLLQVHDELVFEVKTEALDEQILQLRNLMEGVFAGQQTRGVPVEVEVKVGDNWADLQKWTQ
ncbi:hypothetical protein KC722_01205 [Candidatus Kaiserbacteria bacterium]|nr:hypothetical protein [Candidatus Kaiserbacteria bacterium]